jgi:hypothetical protein
LQGIGSIPTLGTLSFCLFGSAFGVDIDGLFVSSFVVGSLSQLGGEEHTPHPSLLMPSP